jgi:2,3-dihydroxybenzoate-AMP ligase
MLDGFVPWPAELAATYRARGYWGGRSLGDLFVERAARHPRRTAVVCGERRTSYGELALEVDRLCAGLLGLGLTRDDRVVVQLPNITEFVTLMFALFRIGVIPVLALPGHRRSEIIHLCRHSGAVAYVTVDRHLRFDHRERARAAVREVPSVKQVLIVGAPAEFTSFSSVLADAPVTPGPLPAVDPAGVALMLLSGGTTGAPKLIPRTHDDYAYNMLACAEGLGVDENGVYLAANPIAHNAALGCPGVLGTLLVGGKAVLASSPSPDEVFPLIAREAVTLTTLVPSLVLLWIDAARFTPVDLSAMVLQVGSSKFGPEAAAQARDVLGCRLTQWFGIGEGLLTFTRLDDPEDVVIATEGRPLCPDDELRVVGDDDGELRPGEVGELLTRGPYTIRGYYNSPEQNAKAFTADGFFRTGDLVRLTPDGNLVVSGRAKDIINRGGDKVSAEEIEDHLLTHPDVRDVAVVGVADPRLGERTYAYVVAREQSGLRLTTLRAYLRDRGLAGYKLPDQLELVPDLPLTAVGKVAKAVLRERATTR